jgi:hypothetical protein
MAPAPTSVETLNAELGTLVAERQALREQGAGERRLETNRRRIVRVQWQLSRALIARYLPAAA